MPELKFSTNWNKKLDTKAFTTFRMHNPMHYQVGKCFTVTVQGKPYCNAKLISIKTMKLGEVDEFQARLDTGYPKHQFVGMIKKMYKSKALRFDTQLFDLLLFERLDFPI